MGKQVILLIVLLAIANSSYAWVSKDQPAKEYTFKFMLHKHEDLAGRAPNGVDPVEMFEVRRAALSYDDAFNEAALECARHFRGGRHLTESDRLDIVDACANPRS